MIKTNKFVKKNNMRTFNKNDDFIFELIHDLKAPIISMDFALKNIRRDEFLDEIFKINRHNLNYVENMMNSYSLAKGRYCPKFELVNLANIVKEEARVLNFLIAEKNLRVIISIDKLVDPYIVGDKYLIRQIILNLLTNAVKYTPVDCTIKIIFEKKEGFLTICFLNPYNEKQQNLCSTKMGLEIVKKKLRAIKGKLKVLKNSDEICFQVSFESK